MEKAATLSPPAIDLPARLEVWFQTADLAEISTWIKGVERTGRRAVAIEGDDPLAMYRAFVGTSYITRRRGAMRERGVAGPEVTPELIGRLAEWPASRSRPTAAPSWFRSSTNWCGASPGSARWTSAMPNPARRAGRLPRGRDDRVSAVGSATPASDGLSFLSIAALGERYRRGELSPLDVVRASLERIERLDGRLNAWITVAADEALAAAAGGERSLRAGEDRGPLHGIPVALKDNVDTAGMATTCASRILRSNVPASDAAVAARLRDAGAIVVGKTNLLEFAYGIVHPDFGQCNNPWNTDRTSGGSSSGSAAAVAAGMVPLAVGTDTGGSIRIPAAYCGIVGLKPTYGLVSRRGVFPLSWSLDHVGPLARSAQDALLLLRAMAGPQGGRRGFAPPRRTAWRACGSAWFASTWARTFVGRSRGVRRAALAVMSEAGARVDEVGIPALAHADDAEMPIIAPEATAVHEEWLRSRPQDYAPMTRIQLEMGLTIPATEYVRAQRFRSLLSSQFAEAFERFDIVASPTVAWVAPAEDPAIAGDEGAIEGRRTGPYNLTGMPAVTVPCGLAEDGLPAALQLAGPWWSDELVLRAAAAFEVRSGWGAPVPPAVSAEEAS